MDFTVAHRVSALGVGEFYMGAHVLVWEIHVNVSPEQGRRGWLGSNVLSNGHLLLAVYIYIYIYIVNLGRN